MFKFSVTKNNPGLAAKSAQDPAARIDQLITQCDNYVKTLEERLQRAQNEEAEAKKKHDITCKAMEDVRREHSEVRSSLAQLNATKRVLEQDIAVKETANAEVSAQLEDVKQELNEVEKVLQMKRKETISQIKDIWEQVE